MGHLLSFFARLGQTCVCSSDQQDMDTVALKLTDRQVEDLSQIIVSEHMATIAIKYLGLPQETVENLKSIRQSDYVAFNRDPLILWRNKNFGINQVQVSKTVRRCHWICIFDLVTENHSAL